MKHHSLLSTDQKRWLSAFSARLNIKLNIRQLEGCIYVLKTGCQWRLLPACFGKCKSVYHRFRRISESPWFDEMPKRLLRHRCERARVQEHRYPTMAIVESQSVKSGLPQSRKGIDGNKRIKGVKRHIAADSDGLPLGEVVTTANVHDSKAAYPLIGGLCAQHPHIKTIKADNGYRSRLTEVAQTTLSVDLQCVNSNFGTSEFIPSEGRRGGASAPSRGLTASADCAATTSGCCPRRRKWRKWPS